MRARGAHVPARRGVPGAAGAGGRDGVAAADRRRGGRRRSDRGPGRRTRRVRVQVRRPRVGAGRGHDPRGASAGAAARRGTRIALRLESARPAGRRPHRVRGFRSQHAHPSRALRRLALHRRVVLRAPVGGDGGPGAGQVPRLEHQPRRKRLRGVLQRLRARHRAHRAVDQVHPALRLAPARTRVGIPRPKHVDSSRLFSIQFGVFQRGWPLDIWIDDLEFTEDAPPPPAS